jgi:hypothetical protein
MSPLPSAPQLIELVHHFYPTNLYDSEPDYQESEQFQRLLAARHEAQVQRSDPWKKLLHLLREALPECKVEDWTVLWSDDNCWRARVYLPGPVEVSGGREARAVVLLVSILAPLYVLYSSFHLQTAEKRLERPRLFYEDVPETKRVADLVESLAKQELDIVRLPNETLFTLVPDIQCRNVMLGNAKLVDCLFTDDRW